MSKMDALRAMREARYEENQARAAGKTTGPPARVARRPVAAPAPANDQPDDADEAPEEQLCGHRNMGGRTCTREQGHAAKSHRYS